MAFHNTTQETGEQLIMFTDIAERQKDIILEYLQNNPNVKLTPFEIHDACFDDSVPITSTRRALSDLVDEGKILDTKLTGEKRPGKLGRPNFLWFFLAGEK